MSDLLHTPDPARAARAQLASFARFVAERTGRTFPSYPALHAFSIRERSFWRLLLEWSGALTSGACEPVCVGDEVETARFFPGLRLSWAENLLAPRTPEEEGAPALVACDETGAREELTRSELRRRVRAVAAALGARGLEEGDRVVAVARNTAETIVACLAVTSLGATWSSVGPEMGLDAALSRFRRLAPSLLLAHRAAWANGSRVEPKLLRILQELPSLREFVALDEEDAPFGAPVPHTTLRALEREGSRLAPAAPAGAWRRFPFDHPLFILFSSGTTGAPKCIVHGHGGTLLEHMKEHRLHCDLGPRDRLFFHTSTGWMMWNWAASALASGACVVVYDGSVSYPERDALLRLVARERVTVFGTSPAYIQYLADSGVEPQPGSLAALREMHSTGSVLYPHLHRWAKEHLADVPLQSISGGTDIVGCFVQGSPWSPVYAGESGCVGLGLDVRVQTPLARLRRGRGELVCASPFPSRPVELFGDSSGARFHEAYFAKNEGIWTHGDLLELTARGTARVLGRCDGVINIRGIRIGPGEIYDVLAAAVPEVTCAMAADQDAPQEPGGKRLVLLVVLRPGLALDRALALRIKKELKQRASAAHVPAVVLQVEELPTTFSGKRSETALQDALSGRPVRNRSALRNPDCLDRILRQVEAAEAPRRGTGPGSSPRDAEFPARRA